MPFQPADLDDPHVADLFLHHARTAAAQTAAGSAHALDLSGLRRDDMQVWTLWDEDALMATGALKSLGNAAGEIKAMHVRDTHRGQGLGSRMLRHLIASARTQGWTQLYLETGAWPYFEPAWALYRREGFVECEPFGDYRPDPNSRFFTLPLLPADGS